MKILPLGIELFHEDRHDEANGRLPQFYERAYKRKTVIQHPIYIMFLSHEDKLKRREMIIQLYGLICLLCSKRLCNEV
jgi:hypothetical protein